MFATKETYTRVYNDMKMQNTWISFVCSKAYWSVELQDDDQTF